ncbi:MAG: Clp protease ClpP [Alistipes sp.]|nr:Clp protease ClpP [Alistipes sp.]
MKSEINIRNSADVCRIEIEGTIGVPEEWQFDEPSARVATYEKFRDTVARIANIDSREIVVDIRSTGGDVNDALLIYDALSALDAHITTRCYGYTASAATIIAQAASEGCRLISANALYLIHNSSCATEGNACDLESKADLLRKTDIRLAEVYAARSGRSSGEFAALMGENGGEGRWLSPEEAVAAGLADAVTGEQPARKEKVTDSLARKWDGLRSALGIPRKAVPETPEDRNVLHFGELPTASANALIAFDEGQRQTKPTTVRQTEDPSVCDIRRTANEEAYAADVRGFSRI